MTRTVKTPKSSVGQSGEQSPGRNALWTTLTLPCVRHTLPNLRALFILLELSKVSRLKVVLMLRGKKYKNVFLHGFAAHALLTKTSSIHFGPQWRHLSNYYSRELNHVPMYRKVNLFFQRAPFPSRKELICIAGADSVLLCFHRS